MRRLLLPVLLLVAASACTSTASTSRGGAGEVPAGSRMTVTGRLVGVGGPAPGVPRPWDGTVSWRGPTHGTVAIAGDGRFVLSLPPGRYELSGYSPHYGDGRYLCQAPHALVVRPGAPTHLDVLCQMK